MASAAKRLRWSVEYAALGVVRGAARLLPRPWLSAAGRGLGRFAGQVLGLRRAVVLENLGHAFPELDDRQLRELAGRVYAQLGMSLVEFLRLGDLSPADLRECVRIEDEGRLDALRAAGRGALLTTGHFGNWEYLGAALAANGYPVSFLVKDQSNARVDRAQNEIRRRAGMGVIRQSALGQIVKAVRGGEFVGILPDQNAGGDGVFVDFMGRPASAARGLAWLAWRLDCPIVPVAIIRRPEGDHRAVFRDPIEPDPGAEEEAEVRRLTEAHTRALEAFVRAHPDHYFWVHRRWKTRPPQEGAD